MWFVLATVLGAPVTELQQRMTYAEFIEWIAYQSNETIGYARADGHNAALMALLANIHRGKGKRKYKAKDFMPQYWPKVELNWQQLLNKTKKVFAALGAR